MTTAQLLQRNLSYYWRTNLAVVLGVAIAVAVLAGALIVGDSVRASLRDLFLQRLGNTDHVIAGPGFFREQLADDLKRHKEFASKTYDACPLIVVRGTVVDGQSQRRAMDIRVYGVDERFWRFHQRENRAPAQREVMVSESLAAEMDVKTGDSLLLIMEKPAAIPVESLHGRKDEVGRTLRLTIRESITAADLGEFSLQPQQSSVRAVFVPLALLQKELDQPGKVNTILLSGTHSPEASGTLGLETILRETATLADFGITLRPIVEQNSISLETERKLIDEQLAEKAGTVADELSLGVRPVLSYLANRISSGERSIPYSLVTAVDDETLGELLGAGTERRGDGETGRPPPMVLNEWAARDLGVQPGDPVSLEYYLWHEEGRIETSTAQFQLAAVVPLQGIAADRDLVPEYPGITESEGLADWDPPFPIDLGRVRKHDEDYWDQYRTTPKAFIPLSVGQELWQSRFGKLTSLRITPAKDSSLDDTLTGYSSRLRETLSPALMGLQVLPVRSQGLEASQGSTDFGQYFLYFSFFLVISALMLAALFFKLGVEQRLREIGILEAIGFQANSIRNLFLVEGAALALVGSVLGLGGALGYGQLMMVGLRTWWVDAVGTTMLALHVGAFSLLAGAFGGIIAAVVCIVWTMKRLGRESTRSLLTGVLSDTETGGWGDIATRDSGSGTRVSSPSNLRVPASSRPRVPASPRLPVSPSPRRSQLPRLASLFTASGLLLLVAAFLNLIGQVAGFFGGGTLLLIGVLGYQSAWLKSPRRKLLAGAGWWSISRLGFRNSSHRPGRSVLCIALIASAAFIIVAVDAFRRDTSAVALDPGSGGGGYPLLAESLLPLVHDPNTAAGHEALNLETTDSENELAGVNFVRFRVRPGDDASCLNLYQPRNPRIIAPPDEFILSQRFAFQNSLAETQKEKENPWLLLKREFSDGAIPVIGDANSLTYIMHLKLGDDLVLDQSGGPIRLRVVAALRDSIFQSELLMSEANFLKVFPQHQGHRFFLIDTPARDRTATVAALLEDRLSDYGFDVSATNERLANFHRVENTFLSTFQILGGLGLLLGTFGMAAVLLRNVLERRRELALLRAVGYNSRHLTLMVIAENAFLLCCGLVTGTVCAILAIAPVLIERGGQLPNASLVLLLLAVLITGLTASLVATLAALRSPLLPALRAE